MVRCDNGFHPCLALYDGTICFATFALCLTEVGHPQRQITLGHSTKMVWKVLVVSIGLVDAIPKIYKEGVEVEVRGMENLKASLRGSPTLGLFQHSSNLDGVIICAISPVTFKWIGKRSSMLV